jgi:hypothetical protein
MELHARAADSYAKLASRHPDDAQWKTALASERAALIAVPTAPGAANP